MKSIQIFLTIGFFLYFFSSCIRNDKCRKFYIGQFKIDKSIISNPKTLEYIRQYSWDTIKLVSNENGKYFFETNDKQLKECEGYWWTTSSDIEGNCVGHIKQKNLNGDVLKFAFDISIKVSGNSYSLPFRKIDQTGNFVKPSISQN